MPFDQSKADRAVRFIGNLKHTKGRWAGVPFSLLPWQEHDIIRPLFGTVKEDGYRQYNTCYAEIPKKNGKSELAAAIALYLLFADNEPGAEIYSAAADRDQAAIVFNVAAQMVRQSPALMKRCKIIDSQKRIVVPKTASFYRVLSAEAHTKHGFNVHGVVFDELHAQPNRELWEVLTEGSGDARTQPVFFAITTAGHDQTSICYEQHEYAIRVKNGLIDDPTFLPVLYYADEEDDWESEEVWYKANPSLGITIDIDKVRTAYQRAKEEPAKENAFRRLRLNQWTAQETRYIPLHAWDACKGDIDMRLPHVLKGRPCYAGMDLSSTTDLTAFVLVFPPQEPGERVKVLPWFWMPEDKIHELSRKDNITYDVWAREGLIQPTPGNVVDYDFLKAKVEELGKLYQIREIAFDPWNATSVAIDLEDMGFVLAEMRQGYKSLSPPTKELLRLVISNGIEHDGNKVLRWMIDCLSVKQDPSENVKPVKPERHSGRKRIDGVVAMIMALDRHMRHEAEPETRGVIAL